MPTPRKPRPGTMHPPVLMVFLMIAATCPLSTEPRSLTIRIRQPQSTNREVTSRITPTTTSGRLEFTKICWPEETVESPR